MAPAECWHAHVQETCRAYNERNSSNKYVADGWARHWIDMAGEVTGNVYGSVPALPSGQVWVERTPQDEITVGATYQVEGSIAQPLVWMFPESWLETWVNYVFSIRHPKFQVTAVQIDSDGKFKI